MKEETLEDVIYATLMMNIEEDTATKDLASAIRTWLLSKIPQDEEVIDVAYDLGNAFNEGYNQALSDIKRNMGL